MVIYGGQAQELRNLFSIKQMIQMTTETPQLNDHNKQEYPPAHKVEFDTSPIAIYTSDDNTISLDVKLENETVWLSQA